MTTSKYSEICAHALSKGSPRKSLVEIGDWSGGPHLYRSPSPQFFLLTGARGRFFVLCVLTTFMCCCMVLRMVYATALQQGALCTQVRGEEGLQLPYYVLAPPPAVVESEYDQRPIPTDGPTDEQEEEEEGEDDGRGGKVHFPRTKRRLPQCIIIGVRKCGTRALLEFLNMHPRVQKAAEEVHFFDDDKRYALGLEWYRRKMPYSFPEQITIEKSPAYFITASVPERIRAMNGSVKLLLIVREPVTRVISDYTQIHSNKVSKGKPHESFESMTLTPEGHVNTAYKAIQISMYAHYLRAWFDAFSREQIHIVDGDQLIEDPFPELQKIEDFLGLDHRISRDNFYFNKTKGFYCLRNETTEKCLGDTKGRKHPQVPPEVVHKLRKFFQPHNARLYDMIGRNMGWPDE